MCLVPIPISSLLSYYCIFTSFYIQIRIKQNKFVEKMCSIKILCFTSFQTTFFSVCSLLFLLYIFCHVLTTPIFESVKVPPDKSLIWNDEFLPAFCSLLSSFAICRTLRFCTCLMLGTTSPSGVSIARLIL